MATTTSTAPAAGTTPAPGAPGATTVPTSTTTTSSSAKAKLKDQNQVPQTAPKLSANELERVTEVFKMYETGLREATIYPKVSAKFLILKAYIGNWKKCKKLSTKISCYLLVRTYLGSSIYEFSVLT